MSALWILPALVLLLVLLAVQRVGVSVTYAEQVLCVRAELGALHLQLYPPKKERKKQTAGKKKTDLMESFGGTFALLKQLLPIVVEAADGLREGIVIREFSLDILWRAEDPIQCAIGYGAANAAVGMLWPLIEQNFTVESRRIRTFPEFKPGVPSVEDLKVRMTMRVWQLLVWAARLAVRLGKLRRKQAVHSQTSKKEAI